jgi:hypothetical protein
VVATFLDKVAHVIERALQLVTQLINALIETLADLACPSALNRLAAGQFVTLKRTAFGI